MNAKKGELMQHHGDMEKTPFLKQKCEFEGESTSVI